MNYSLQQAAKLVGVGPKALSNTLLEENIFIRVGEQRYPKREYIDKGYFYKKPSCYHVGPVQKSHLRIFVTERGINFLRAVKCGMGTQEQIFRAR